MWVNRAASADHAQDIIDGDLCESYGALPFARQKALAADLSRSVAEVQRKLEDIRNKVL